MKPARRELLYLAAGVAALAMSGKPTQAQVARLDEANLTSGSFDGWLAADTHPYTYMYGEIK